jgi:methionyl aminopeptidase
MIPIKTSSEIEKMRTVCQIAATVLDKLVRMVAPGVSTYELDQAGRELISSFGSESACYNYQSGSRRFPAYTCISVNEEVVHGIGRADRFLVPHDCVSIDVCVRYNGFIGDNARTVCAGTPSRDNQRLIECTEAALYKGIEMARAGNYVNDISRAIQRCLESSNLSVVRDFVGHGVGRSIHEEPKIPNYCDPHEPLNPKQKLKAGMTLAIEPIACLGSYQTQLASDGWTALTVDRKPSAHFEHTVLITDHGPEILTVPKNNFSI